MKSLYKRLPSALRAVLPWFIICVCFMILTGCFWVPTFEHQEEYDTTKDFRPLVGDAKSKQPIRPYAINRQQVVALLGQPQFASLDQRAVAYELITVRSAWVHPLCFFFPEPASGRTYVVRLTFDAKDMLVDCKMLQAEAVIAPTFDLNLIASNDTLSDLSKVDALIEQFNESGPALFPIKNPCTQPTTRGL